MGSRRPGQQTPSRWRTGDTAAAQPASQRLTCGSARPLRPRAPVCHDPPLDPPGGSGSPICASSTVPFTSARRSTPIFRSSGSSSTSVTSRSGRRDVSAPASSTHWPRPCRDSRSTAAPTTSRAASSAACARTRAPGSVTCSSTWRSSCRTSPARRSLSARRAAPARRASTRSSTSTSSATKASPRANSGCACSARCCRMRSVRLTSCPRAGAGPRRATSSSVSRNDVRSGLPLRRWCAPPTRAAFPGCG